MKEQTKFLLVALSFIILFLLSGVSILFPDIYYTEGESTSTATAYITTRFSSYQKSSGLHFTMFIPQNVNEGIITQKISRIWRNFTPRPTEINESVDSYGNKKIECIWKKDIRIVQTDLQFTAKIHSQYSSFESEAPYPYQVNDLEKKWLSSTDNAPSNEYLINYIGRSLAENLNREIDVVYSVLLWVDTHIALNLTSNEKKDALTVLKNREGNEEGISNLIVSLMKGLGIPARVVYGLSFQKEMDLPFKEGRLVMNTPNNHRYWVEIYFPDAGWIPYDPHGYYFSLPSHVIKLAVGPDSNYVSEKWTIDKGSTHELREIIFDIKSDSNKLKITGRGPKINTKIVLSPPVQQFTMYKQEPDLNIEGLKKTTIVKILQKGKRGIIQENKQLTPRVDLMATGKKVYTQQFYLPYPARIIEIRLPLIKFSDGGKIWVDVFEDNKGVPGKRLFRTYSISSSRVRYMFLDNPWLSFPVGKRTNSFLKPGRYWFALRSSGSCIFNWYATEGNTIGTGLDTRYINVGIKSARWNNLLNLDLCYVLLGIRSGK